MFSKFSYIEEAKPEYESIFVVRENALVGGNVLVKKMLKCSSDSILRCSRI